MSVWVLVIVMMILLVCSVVMLGCVLVRICCIIVLLLGLLVMSVVVKVYVRVEWFELGGLVISYVCDRVVGLEVVVCSVLMVVFCFYIFVYGKGVGMVWGMYLV